MNPTPSERALAARDKVAAGWVQKAFAVLSDGSSTGSLDANAVAWCAMGAATGYQVLLIEFARVVGVHNSADIGLWNDAKGRVQQDVVDAWDEVARRFKERGL